MNTQEKIKNGKVAGRGIQWCSHTWNVNAGCFHRCRWTMPDGSVAICYAEEIAKKFTTGYPLGFEHSYWRPQNLSEPLKLKEPAKIFLDSMSDLFGHWVEDSQINQILDVCKQADWHVFQSLTKNAPKLLKFKFPKNVWVGASSPPDSMMGKPLQRHQQEAMLERILQTLTQVRKDNGVVTWISFEPLSWDVSELVAKYPLALRWSVIGAATNGPKVYQPNPDHVQNLLDVLDNQNVPVFFKGNLWGNPAAKVWREYFPGYIPSPYMAMELGPHAVPIPVQNKAQISLF